MTDTKLIDISWPLHDKGLFYPGDPKYVATRTAAVATHGHSMHTLTLCNHVGTHVDAPTHFFDHAMTIDRIDLDILCGEALVLDARPAGKRIDAAFLEKSNLGNAMRLLLRTTNESLLPATLVDDHAGLTPDAALYLRDRTQVQLVGIDYLSIETLHDESLPVHHTLLGANPPIFVLEGLDLRTVDPGTYELLCLPLRLSGLDGAPARAALRRK